MLNKKIISVKNKMQTGYKYELTARMGKDFDPRFKPDLSPKQMLALGVFGGRYMRDCRAEYPADWFAKAKLYPEGLPGHDKSLNYFGVDASQPLIVWQKKGWINPQDPRGWFEWYCRYFMGRRSADDERQIKRWLALSRHIAQLKKNCPSTGLGTSRPSNFLCRPRQRQALLHWAYDSRRM